MSSPSRSSPYFLAALEKKNAVERAEFLDRACGPDVELRRQRRTAAGRASADGETRPRPPSITRNSTRRPGRRSDGIAPRSPGRGRVTYGFEPVRPGQVLETLARSIGSIPACSLPTRRPMTPAWP